MKLLTFLGAGRAYDTAYVMPDGREYVAPFCGVALARFYPDNAMRVFVTKEARSTHLDQFRELAEDFVQDLDPVDIPEGRNEAELWQVFQAVVDNVQRDEQVIFDVTHGFRSLPFLSFLAASYLRVVKDIDLVAVLYGNFEARDKSVQPNRAPVIDMTRFVSLLDWMVASDRFVRFGDARDLAGLLRDRQATPIHLAAAQGDREAQRVGGVLRGVATAIERVAEPLRLARPMEAMKAAADLAEQLTAAQQSIAQWAQPFGVVASQVQQAYGPFGLAEPLAEKNNSRALQIQRDLVGWYVEHGYYIQAAMLAREWVVSYVCFKLNWDSVSGRELAERLLSSEARAGLNNLHLPLEAGARAAIDDAVELWNKLPDLRNDIAHCGFRKRPRSVRSILKTAKALPRELARLALDHNP